MHIVNARLELWKNNLTKKVKINKKDNSETLSKKILKQEHLLYPKALKKMFSKF